MKTVSKGVTNNMDNEKQTNQLPEAPASATVKIKSKNGFEWLFTIRDESAKNLMFKMNAMETNWLNNGFTPLAQNQFGRKPTAPIEYLQGRTCPTDGGRLIKPAAGSTAPIKCENNKYNFQTKQSYGCPFKEWPNQESVRPIPAQSYDEGEY